MGMHLLLGPDKRLGHLMAVSRWVAVGSLVRAGIPALGAAFLP